MSPEVLAIVGIVIGIILVLFIIARQELLWQTRPGRSTRTPREGASGGHSLRRRCVASV